MSFLVNASINALKLSLFKTYWPCKSTWLKVYQIWISLSLWGFFSSENSGKIEISDRSKMYNKFRQVGLVPVRNLTLFLSHVTQIVHVFASNWYNRNPASAWNLFHVFLTSPRSLYSYRNDLVDVSFLSFLQSRQFDCPCELIYKNTWRMCWIATCKKKSFLRPKKLNDEGKNVQKRLGIHLISPKNQHAAREKHKWTSRSIVATEFAAEQFLLPHILPV